MSPLFLRARRPDEQHSIYVCTVMSALSEAQLGQLIEDMLVYAHGDSEHVVVFECAFAESGLPAG
jgi:hypothetical protein